MIRLFCEVFAALTEPVMNQDAYDKVEENLVEALVLWQHHAHGDLLGGGQFHWLLELLRHARVWGSPTLFWCFRCVISQ